MSLVSGVYALKVVYFHVKCLLVLADALHLAHQLSAFNLVALDSFDHHLNGLSFVKVLSLHNLVREFCCSGHKLGNLLGNLPLHVFLALVSLFTGLTQLVAQFSLEDFSCLDLALTTSFLFTDLASTDAKLEDAAVQLDSVLDPLEVLVDALHALELAHVGPDSLRVFADGVDLLLEPELLGLDSPLDGRRQLLSQDSQASLGDRHQSLANRERAHLDHANILRLWKQVLVLLLLALESV